MKRFYITLLTYLIISISPLLILIFRYIYLDPYCDFNIDKTYSLKYWFNSLGDFSTKKLIKNKDFNRNTFIFGSSRSTHIYGCYLQKSVFKNDKKIHPYFFGNYGESIGGIYQKLSFLTKNGYKIKNAIILLDPDIAFESTGDAKTYDYHSFVNRGQIYDYVYHFNSYFSNQNNDLQYKLKILFGLPISDSIVYLHKSDPISNDQGHICKNYIPFNDSLFIQKKMKSKKHLEFIKNSSDFKLKKFRVKDKISTNEIHYIKKIKQIFDKNNSQYVLIISPLLNYERFTKKDLNHLNNIFGSKFILNFSGKNNITVHAENFKDPKHFNTLISKEIIDSIQKSGIFLTH